MRDYLYIPLGGNRGGKTRRYVNLITTMLLGGLWHGAGWTFVVWGGLHGSYLVINHAWCRLLGASGFAYESAIAYRVFSWSVTFFAVVVAWVYFRAPSLEQANSILGAMLGLNGASLPYGLAARLGGVFEVLQSMGVRAGDGSGVVFVSNYLWIIIAMSVALLLPNVAQIFHSHEPVLYEKSDSFSQFLGTTEIKWRVSRRWALVTASMLVLGLLTLMQVSEFLYFQF